MNRLHDRYAFQDFVLDVSNRRLEKDGAPVALNSRYLDALCLLVREHGQLVSKQQFLEQVWQGVPVTDEVITQCIKTLRKKLDDKASNPQFIETVPKHGYRFIATVNPADSPVVAESAADNAAVIVAGLPGHWRRFFLLGSMGAVGGGIAGVIGGVLFGFAAASQQTATGMGAISVLLVVTSITALLSLLGGAGVGFGIAAAGIAVRRSLLSNIAGGAAGGMLIGAVVKLLGVDAFNLLFGESLGDITGAFEGVLLGAAVGFSAWLAVGRTTPLSARRGIAVAALAGAVAGILITLMGGRLMAGSLDLLARQITDSTLRLDRIGALFGEDGFGPVSQMVVGGLEGGLFAGCIVAAVLFAQRPTGH